jgi:hypothetical protein
MLVTETQTGVTSDHQTLFPSTSFPAGGPASNWLAARGYRAAEKTLEDLSREVRAIRDGLLRNTDKLGLTDRPAMSDEYVEYRQALRDITAQEGFPYTVSFPNIPE